MPTARETAHPPAEHDNADQAFTLHVRPHEREFLRDRLDGLTKREREVVFALCDGGTNEGMAERLFIALPTLRTHLMRLNQKLGTTSKGDVIRYVAGLLLDGYRSSSLRPERTPLAEPKPGAADQATPQHEAAPPRRPEHVVDHRAHQREPAAHSVPDVRVRAQPARRTEHSG